ncbi:MAG: hypothetical protein Q4B48_03925, partial [Syntrophomonadaceae bacterium]|nr:hypothetical protein [Syntrophomonadaceae bacterium]
TLNINGVETETIGMPWSWAFAAEGNHDVSQGYSRGQGPSTNSLTMAALDPGAGTPEYKCCLVNVRRA